MLVICISTVEPGLGSTDMEGVDGRVVKVLDYPPQDRGFESRHTLGLLCLKSLGKICTPNVP